MVPDFGKTDLTCLSPHDKPPLMLQTRQNQEDRQTMPRLPQTLMSLTLAALLAQALPVLAQTATPPATEQPATEQPAAEQPATEQPVPNATLAPQPLDLGTPAEEGPGTAYIRETTGDWQIECIRVPEGQEEPCQMFQPMIDADGNQVANVRIFRLPEGGEAVAGALVAVPLETLLTAQLTITVDNAKPQRYPFSVCDRLGCYARLGFRKAEVDAYKKGAKATITLVPFVAPDQKVDLDMSLKGFTAAFDKSSVIKP